MESLEWQIIGPPDNSPTIAEQLAVWLKRFIKICWAITVTAQKGFKYLWIMEKIVFTSEEYSLVGEAKDSEWVVKNRHILEQYMMEEMREHGFIPVLDMNTDIEMSYKPETETFDYKIICKGYQVGRAKALRYAGVLVSQGIVIAQDGETVALINAL